MYVKKAKRQVEIYGITGSKGHGKDTFARLVLSAHAERLGRKSTLAKTRFSIVHFADALKHMAGRVFGLSDAQMQDPVKKETALVLPVRMDQYLAHMQTETGLTLPSAACTARTPRELLQYFGTEYVRRAQPDYWLQRLVGDVRTKRRVLVPDVRFPNEAAALVALGGRIIRIVRIDADVHTDVHASETEMAGIEPDLVLGVRTNDLSLMERVAYLLATGKYKAALKYDYRLARLAMNAYVSGKSAEDVASAHFASRQPWVLYNLLEYYAVPRRREAPNRVEHRVQDGVEQKWCSRCSQWSALELFNRASKSWDGRAGICRTCASTANKELYQQYGKVDSLAAVVSVFRRTASNRGRTFSLTLEEVKDIWARQDGRCFYSGRTMTLELNDPDKVSLDRVDSSLEYTLGNVVLCTARVNLMKRAMSLEEFQTITREVAAHDWNTALCAKPGE